MKCDACGTETRGTGVLTPAGWFHMRVEHARADGTEENVKAHVCSLACAWFWMRRTWKATA